MNDENKALELDEQAVAAIREGCEALRTEVGKVIVGQKQVVEEILIAILARGHALLMGVPGLAKTLLVRTLSQSMNLGFNRIQFTPDLMPSDITGTEIIEDVAGTGNRVFRFIKGPIFANIVLADEINRTPPKTQAALLQSMQEYEVTASGKTYDLELPFFVLATQNPIEQEGTYPLPEAQLDRFMFLINVGYPGREEEYEIVDATTGVTMRAAAAVMSAEDIIRFQNVVRQVPVPRTVLKYAVHLVRATRPRDEMATEMSKRFLTWGASPRASQYLILGGRARAVMNGRYNVSFEDIRHVMPSVLRHRVVMNFNAKAEDVTVDDFLSDIVKHVEEPKE